MTPITDTAGAVIEKLVPWAGQYLTGRVQKGHLTPEAVQSALVKFYPATSTAEAAADADLVVEAII